MLRFLFGLALTAACASAQPALFFGSLKPGDGGALVATFGAEFSEAPPCQSHRLALQASDGEILGDCDLKTDSKSLSCSATFPKWTREADDPWVATRTPLSIAYYDNCASETAVAATRPQTDSEAQEYSARGV